MFPLSRLLTDSITNATQSVSLNTNMGGRVILVVLVACFVIEITGRCVDRKHHGGRLNTGLWSSSVVA